MSKMKKWLTDATEDLSLSSDIIIFHILLPAFIVCYSIYYYLFLHSSVMYLEQILHVLDSSSGFFCGLLLGKVKIEITYFLFIYLQIKKKNTIMSSALLVFLFVCLFLMVRTKQIGKCDFSCDKENKQTNKQTR